MPANENQIRSSLFGGFNRQDVARFLSKQKEEHKASVDQLRNELNKANEQLTSLNRQVEEAAAEKEAFLICKEEADSLKIQSESLQNEISQLREEIKSLNAIKEELSLSVDALKADAESYNLLKSQMAEIELESRKRAQLILDDAEENARVVKADAEAYALDRKRDMNNWIVQMQNQYWSICSEFDTSIESAYRELSASSTRLERWKQVIDEQAGKLHELDIKE